MDATPSADEAVNMKQLLVQPSKAPPAAQLVVPAQDALTRLTVFARDARKKLPSLLAMPLGIVLDSAGPGSGYEAPPLAPSSTVSSFVLFSLPIAAREAHRLVQQEERAGTARNDAKPG
ncbi:unnamed protein product [Clonostachys rosea]|uniref:Uncharacterized protein n=1 Tax=Bionectria ochroleuca TaxID=29856 RepID=A0ABY6UVT1_BIOOC|nr:unnamed protein product [Clonostachys rosea]